LLHADLTQRNACATRVAAHALGRVAGARAGQGVGAHQLGSVASISEVSARPACSPISAAL
jgi:hypothetical protein